MEVDAYGRATLDGVDDEGWHVTFVDWGKTVVVEQTNVKQIKSDFLLLPPQAVHVSCNIMRDLVSNYCYTA